MYLKIINYKNKISGGESNLCPAGYRLYRRQQLGFTHQHKLEVLTSLVTIAAVSQAEYTELKPEHVLEFCRWCPVFPQIARRIIKRYVYTAPVDWRFDKTNRVTIINREVVWLRNKTVYYARWTWMYLYRYFVLSQLCNYVNTSQPLYWGSQPTRCVE